VNPERAERSHEFFVESGDGARDEAERSCLAEAGLDFQSVVDEIEVNFEDPFFVGHSGGGEASSVNVERGAPPMI
jgi:hypothetical protein